MLVFAAGFAAGMAVDRTWFAGGAGEHESRDEDHREKTVIERFSDELGLTRQQETRIDTILERYRARMHEIWKEVRPRYRALVDSVRHQIEAELTEEQVRQYRKLLRRETDADVQVDDTTGEEREAAVDSPGGEER